MLVYSADNGPRFTYITSFFLGKLCGLSISVTNDPMELRDYPGLAICYDEAKLSPRSIHIKPCGLLSEEGLQALDPVVGSWGELPCFFSTDGDIPFDILSASFFLITRYEEYLPHEKDLYGRYPHTSSLAYNKSFLPLPLVDLWAAAFRNLFPVAEAGVLQRSFSFVPTYDIDIAWAYLNKGFVRNLGGFLKSLGSGNWQQVEKRFQVLRGMRPDPFDVYEWLDALHLRYSLKPIYFFLLAKQNSEYDKNILPSNKEMRNLVSYHSSGYKTGIHPSWRSRTNLTLFENEIRTLENICGLPVKNSRFHYIAFNLPADYRKLQDQGIDSDFSMGYGTINGFRASVSIPFPWYDLERESSTDLMVYPYCWMDANSYYEQLYEPAQAFAELKSYHDVVKSVKGQLMTISHNNFLSDEPGFSGWKDVYEIFLDQVVYSDL
jgi:hypothetical protein